MKHQFKDQVQKPTPEVQAQPVINGDVMEIIGENQVSDIPASAVETVSVKRTGTIDGAQMVNFRKTPETNPDNILGILNAGTKVEVIEDKGDWSEVVVGDKTGYVMSKFVK